jgi:hypothetical protein
MKDIKYYIILKETYRKQGNMQGVKLMDEAIAEANKNNGQRSLK